MLKKIGKRMKDQRGLTLVELLAVVVILGVIAAIAVPSIGNIVAKSKFDASKADAIQLIHAGKMYVAANGNTGSPFTKAVPGALEDYIEITGENLSDWTVTISNEGKVKVTASFVHPGKTGTAKEYTDQTLNDINTLKFETE